MNGLTPLRYKLFKDLGDSNDSFFDNLGYIYLSRFPSKDDILDVLQQNGELTEYDQTQIDNFYIERPDGWDYKTIMIFFDYNKFFCVWKIEPAPFK